ncbi:MAG: CDP-alcohol phosphatidyltransferase family protein [Chloroflexota bacterium]|nr:CDP-alcohol phosphatidyltransferase family protein [Chloroflexota bacterium]
MSASHQGTHDLARGDSLVPAWLKELGRAVLGPIVRLALRLHLSPNVITILGFLIVLAAAAVIALGYLLIGAAILVGGSALDAVDGALARARGGGTAFGSFLDSTLDRAGEAGVYLGIAAYYLANSPNPTWPVLAAILALAGSFMVSYSRARAEGIGLTAAIGLAPRTERVVLIVAGLGLAGLGLSPALSGVLWAIAALTVATTAQRIWHVWRLTEATSPGEQP